MVAAIIVSILHVPMCFLFVKGFDMGVIGLAWATTVKEAILLLVVVIYSKLTPKIDEVI